MGAACWQGAPRWKGIARDEKHRVVTRRLLVEAVLDVPKA